MALLVNSIVDFSSMCTSIVVRNETSYTHVRNLDFDFPEQMQKLIYIQEFVKDGKSLGLAPSIAGFFGAYTGMNDKFSFSYNVRFGHGNRTEAIWENLHNELREDYKPF